MHRRGQITNVGIQLQDTKTGWSEVPIIRKKAVQARSPPANAATTWRESCVVTPFRLLALRRGAQIYEKYRNGDARLW